MEPFIWAGSLVAAFLLGRFLPSAPPLFRPERTTDDLSDYVLEKECARRKEKAREFYLTQLRRMDPLAYYDGATDQFYSFGQPVAMGDALDCDANAQALLRRREEQIRALAKSVVDEEHRRRMAP